MAEHRFALVERGQIFFLILLSSATKIFYDNCVFLHLKIFGKKSPSYHIHSCFVHCPALSSFSYCKWFFLQAFKK